MEDGSVKDDCSVKERHSQDYCAVNLIVGWKVSICRNCCNCSSPSFQTAEKLSLYLWQMDGLFTVLWSRCFSSSPMKILA